MIFSKFKLICILFSQKSSCKFKFLILLSFLIAFVKRTINKTLAFALVQMPTYLSLSSVYSKANYYFSVLKRHLFYFKYESKGNLSYL